MTRLTMVLCGLWAALVMTVADAHAQRRVALVIGNGGYQNAGKLPNSSSDANAVAALLRKAGFDVVETKLDIGNAEFKRAVRDFAPIARESDIAAVYFAGHGIEVNGTNYLLPVDAKLASDFDVEDEAVSLDRLMRAIEPARQLRLVILDASRDNPFVTGMRRGVSSRPASAGLAKVEPASTEALIVYAAAPGAVIDEAQGGKNPFTAALLDHLTVQGRDVRTALGHVRDDVLRATGNRQEPFIGGSLSGTTIALAPDAQQQQQRTASSTRQISVLPRPGTDSAADPRRDYEFAERVGTREAWDSFLALHPDGFYASLAREQREKLSRRDQTGQQVPAAPAESQNVALLPAPDTQQAPPSPAPDLRVVARELQVELRRVGCDPGTTDGNWSTRSRDALDQFNRRAGMDLDTRGATIAALDAVRGQRGRICPLFCASGQRAEGDRCVAIPAAPKPVKQQAARPERERSRNAEPPPSARRAATKQPVRERVERAAPVRAPTDREVFGGGGRPAGPPISIGIGRGGLGIAGIGIGF